MRARANRSAPAFEDLAERYDAWYDTAPGQVLFDLELGALRPLLAGTAGPRLEVGVGSGRFAAALGIDVGLDPAEAPPRLARARGVRVLRGVGQPAPVCRRHLRRGRPHRHALLRREPCRRARRSGPRPSARRSSRCRPRPTRQRLGPLVCREGARGPLLLRPCSLRDPGRAPPHARCGWLQACRGSLDPVPDAE